VFEPFFLLFIVACILPAYLFWDLRSLGDLQKKQDDDAQMTALSYYMAAVGDREREHVPLIGPTVDRRTLTLVCRLANSSTIRSLMSDLSLKFGWLSFVQ
jgi:hypothetical protein